MAVILANDVIPITKKGIESLSNTDYGTCSKALAELIDNSWELGYPTTRTNIQAVYATGVKNLISITVSDNGPGMTLEVLDKCMTVGSETEKSHETLGTYGMGLKTAGLWCGKTITILTKTNDGKLYKGTMSAKTGRQIEEVEDGFNIKRFKNIVRGNHGTIIAITDIRKERFPKTANGFRDTIARDHSLIFSDIIRERNAEMRVNGNRIQPIDYFDREISTKMSPDGAVWEYIGVDGLTKKIPYEAWYVPGTQGDGFLPRNQENQGIICIRNGRMTGKGLTFGIIAKNNIYNGCRIILKLDGSTDCDFGVSFGKTQRGEIANDDIRASFSKEFKKYFEMSKRYQEEATKKGEMTKALERAMEKAQEKIAQNTDFQEAMKDLKCNAEGNKEGNSKPETHKEKPQDDHKPETKDETEKKHRKPRRAKICGSTIEFMVEGMGEKGHYILPDYTVDGRAVCRINSEHNFYKNYMVGKSDEAAYNLYIDFATEWLSVYGKYSDKTEEAIEAYQKRLLIKSNALSSVYSERSNIEDYIDD